MWAPRASSTARPGSRSGGCRRTGWSRSPRRSWCRRRRVRQCRSARALRSRAGPLPSITQAMEGDGLVGSCGAANTAPSGLSAAVTWSAENGSAMGEPACNGPEARRRGRRGGGGARCRGRRSPGGAGKRSATGNPSRRPPAPAGPPAPAPASDQSQLQPLTRFPAHRRQYGCNGWKVRCTYGHHPRHHVRSRRPHHDRHPRPARRHRHATSVQASWSATRVPGSTTMRVIGRSGSPTSSGTSPLRSTTTATGSRSATATR